MYELSYFDYTVSYVHTEKEKKVLKTKRNSAVAVICIDMINFCFYWSYDNTGWLVLVKSNIAQFLNPNHSHLSSVLVLDIEMLI